jgi:hypothetical protein
VLGVGGPLFVGGELLVAGPLLLGELLVGGELLVATLLEGGLLLDGGRPEELSLLLPDTDDVCEDELSLELLPNESLLPEADGEEGVDGPDEVDGADDEGLLDAEPLDDGELLLCSLEDSLLDEGSLDDELAWLELLNEELPLSLDQEEPLLLELLDSELDDEGS